MIPYPTRERPRREMSESLKSIGAITLFVDDPQRSKAFYARVFEAEVAFEDDNAVAFKFDNLILNLLKRGAAVNELLGPVPPAAAGASFELTSGSTTPMPSARTSSIAASRSSAGRRTARGDCARRRSSIPTATSGRSPADPGDLSR